jgi:hypothetical protein
MVLSHLHSESSPGLKMTVHFWFLKYEENRQENKSGPPIYLHLGFPQE